MMMDYGTDVIVSKSVEYHDLYSFMRYVFKENNYFMCQVEVIRAKKEM